MNTADLASARSSLGDSSFGGNTIAEVGSSLSDDPLPWLWFGLAALSLCVAALGAIASSSLLMYSPAKLNRLLEGGRNVLLSRLSEYRTSYHALARSLAIVGVVASGVMIWHGSGTNGARFAAMAVFALLALVTCGVLPGNFAAHRAERVVVCTHGILEALRRLLHYPVLVPLIAIARGILRVLRIQEAPHDPEGIADEIFAAVEDKTSHSGLDEEEREWIENIVALKHTCASEIMTPRTDTVAFPRDMPLLDALREATEAGFSRFPVYDQKLDNVVGVFYAKDALPLIGDSSEARASAMVGSYVRKPLFVPESMDVVDLLRQFRTSRVQMAIVLDEYGGTAGLVSIEDVLEEIVGDISDEYDPDDEIPIKVIEEGRVVETSGRVRIDEINEVLPVSIPITEDYDTVAGFVFTSLDRIPRVHEAVEIDGVEFEVLEGDERRIIRLRLTVAPPVSVGN